MRWLKRWWRQVTGFRRSVDSVVEVLREMHLELLEVEAERREEATRLREASEKLERAANHEVEEAARARNVALNLGNLTGEVLP